MPFFIRKKLIKACAHQTIITKNNWLNECFRMMTPQPPNITPNRQPYDSPLLQTLADYVQNQTMPPPNPSGIKAIPFKALITYLQKGNHHA